MKPVYRLLLRCVLMPDDEFLCKCRTCRGAWHITGVAGMQHDETLMYRRRCTQREAALARKIGLVK